MSNSKTYTHLNSSKPLLNRRSLSYPLFKCIVLSSKKNSVLVLFYQKTVLKSNNALNSCGIQFAAKVLPMPNDL